MINIQDHGYKITIANTLVKQTVVRAEHDEIHPWIDNQKNFYFLNATCSIEFYIGRPYCIRGNKLLLNDRRGRVIVCEFKTKIKWFNKIGAD